VEYLIFILALGALVYGAELVINQSERIALHFNISPFVIGASLIAFGTSLPEMAASMNASWVGKSEMAVSNVLGSVMLNITLVLGVIFLIADSMKPERDLFNVDSAWIFIPLALFIVSIFDGEISRFEGVLLLLVMVAYLFFLAADEGGVESEVGEADENTFQWLKVTGLLLAGFVLLIGGADFTIDSASTIARSLGVSEWVIGLLLLALGTSLPELIVSIRAAMKGSAEMSIGNIIGSNVANFSMVLGAAAFVRPLGIDIEASLFDLVLVSIISFVFIFILANRLYSRATGVILLLFLAIMINNALQVASV